MKHFIDVLIILILTGFAIGIAYLQVNNNGPWGVLFLPLFILMLLSGEKIYENYE
jgi:Ni,Fe-hydrogenase I cytochrome b subunit